MNQVVLYSAITILIRTSQEYFQLPRLQRTVGGGATIVEAGATTGATIEGVSSCTGDDNDREARLRRLKYFIFYFNLNSLLTTAAPGSCYIRQQCWNYPHHWNMLQCRPGHECIFRLVCWLSCRRCWADMNQWLQNWMFVKWEFPTCLVSTKPEKYFNWSKCYLLKTSSDWFDHKLKNSLN